MKNKIFIISGVPGSGKSTLAKKMYDTSRLNSSIVNNDRLRQMITGTDDANMNDTYHYESASEISAIMWLIKKAIIEALLEKKNGHNIILDAVHFKKENHDYFQSLTGKYDLEIINIFLNIDKKIALERAQQRVRKEDKETIIFCKQKLEELNLQYDYILLSDEEIEKFFQDF